MKDNNLRILADALHIDNNKENIIRLINCLQNKERDIIAKKFGIYKKYRRTSETKLAEEYGMTVNQVRISICKSIKKLRIEACRYGLIEEKYIPIYKPLIKKIYRKSKKL